MLEPELRPQSGETIRSPKGDGSERHTSGRNIYWRRIVPGLAMMVAAGWAVAALQSKDSGKASTPTTNQADVPRFAVVINRPSGPPQVATGRTNFQGQPVFASCSSCHTTTKPNLEVRRTEDLDQFHQGLKYTHGNLTCLSCHNSSDYDTLRLADTRTVAFPDSMTLCSQCHGPQRRDYDRGLHGGMNGYWDLTRGGRTRNTCINCHDPHTPKFPMVQPVLPPRDRVAVPHDARAGKADSHP